MRTKAVLLAALAGTAFIAACSSRITCSTTTFKTPIGEITHVTRGQDPNRTMDITGDEESTGQCVTIQFKDGGGNPVGAPVTVTVPATNIPVPTGSTDIEGGECEEDEEATRASAGQNHISPGRPWTFFGGPISSDFSQPGGGWAHAARPRARYPRARNTATEAVRSCKKLRPPTGPISPAARKPATGTSSARLARTHPMSWFGSSNIRLPRSLHEKIKAPTAWLDV